MTYINKVHMGESLSWLIDDQSKFSQEKFGTDQQRGPIGPLKHMAKEVQETIEAYAGCQNREVVLSEFADILILLLDSSRRAGFTFQEIVNGSIAKMEINKSRNWPPFDPTKVNEAVLHIKKENQ